MTGPPPGGEGGGGTPLWRFLVSDGDFSGLTIISSAEWGGTPAQVGEGTPPPLWIADPLPPPTRGVGPAQGGSPRFRMWMGVPPLGVG